MGAHNEKECYGHMSVIKMIIINLKRNEKVVYFLIIE